MPDANELAKDAAAAAKKVEKALPELRSPMTRLPEEIRKIIAVFCRDSGVSFSPQTVLLWIDFLKLKGLIPADMVIDLSTKRGASSFREKEVAYQSKLDERDIKIRALEAALAAAKAAKK